MAIMSNVGNDEGDQDFGDMLSGKSSGLEKHREVLTIIRDLVRRVGLLAPDDLLDVLRLSVCGLHDALL